MQADKRSSPTLADAQRAERAAAGLSSLEREVLILSAGRGLRNADIAEILSISERRAERLLARALRKFDRAIRGDRKRLWRLG